MRRLFALAVVASLGLVACGDQEDTDPRGSIAQQASHIHGLGVNPADGSLFIATHSGLFQARPGSTTASQVGREAQDTMGFTVAGPNRFLGSGHPAPGEDAPPNLGLIESTDAGKSWSEVSLGGEADFHVLRFSEGRVYGYNGLTGKLMLSEDGGESWSERTPPPAVIDLIADPDDPRRILASTEQGLAVSEDTGETWQPLQGAVGLVAWPEQGPLYLIDVSGRVQVSDDAGDRWRSVGRLGGQPVAFAATDSNSLFAALADGTVMWSSDGGASWRMRTSL